MSVGVSVSVSVHGPHEHFSLLVHAEEVRAKGEEEGDLGSVARELCYLRGGEREGERDGRGERESGEGE